MEDKRINNLPNKQVLHHIPNKDNRCALMRHAMNSFMNARCSIHSFIYLFMHFSLMLVLFKEMKDTLG